ncbi:unnamed protein product, partial [Rotaria magnacalcarata]
FTLIDKSYSIQFYSILISPSNSLHLRSIQSYERFILENHLNNTYEEINGLPIVHWKYLVQTLRSNKDKSKIQILSKTDCLPEQRKVYQLILTFYFTLLKASEIQVKCPYLYELLYDNEYDAALWMCFDTNKQYLGAGDVMKDYSLKLEKGDFVIRIQIRHDKYDLLERFLKDNGGTGLTLHIEHREMNTIYQYFTKPSSSSSSSSSKKSSSSSVSTRKLYEELLLEQQDLNNHIRLHITRLQQLENQLKQQQSYLTNEKKI